MNLGPHETFDAEFTNPSGFIRALDARLDKIGAEPDIVICAFGPFREKPLAKYTAEDWELLTLANLALPGALASRFLPGMIEKRYGRFLFFGGTRTDGIHAYRKTAAYAAAKTGLGVLAKSVAAEGAAHNVAAVVVCPGPTETEYLDNETKRRHASLTPTGSLAQPGYVARTSLDLIDAEPCIASGAIVSLDGGVAP
jgi:NAD(P)-dependent dehydrogenase (short-subunit alcohol dehydrogenase family)